MENRHKARILAFKALYSWELNKTTLFADIVNIERECVNRDIVSTFGQELFDGVLRNIVEIDLIIENKLNNWQIERLDKVDISLLRLGIYSIYSFKNIPKVVSINEAINLSKEFGSDNSYKFINGLLDSIVNDKEVTLSK